MAENILAIDIADGGIILAQASQSLFQRKPTGYVIDDAPKGGGVEALAEAVADAIAKAGLESDIYILGLDARSAILREFFLPVTSQAQISKALDFELEQALPLGREELVSDFVTGVRSGQGRWVTVSSVLRKSLEELLEALRRRGIDPVIVDLDIAAFARVCGTVAEAPEKVVVIDCGRERTQLAFVEKGRLRAGRTVHKGFVEVVGATAERLRMPRDEVWKMLVGDASDKEEGAGGGQLHSASPLRELTEYAAFLLREMGRFSEERDFSPQRIFVCGVGGGSRELAALLEDDDGPGVHPLASQKGDWAEFQNVSDLGSLFRAIGLLMAWPERDNGFNFRMDAAFAYQGTGSTGSRKLLWYGGGLAAAIAVAWVLSFGMHMYKQASTLGAYEDRIHASFRRALPEVQGKFTQAQYLSILQTRVDALRPNVGQGADSATYTLEMIRAIHAGVAPNVDIDLTGLTLDSSRVGLVGTTGNFQAVEALRNNLAAVGLFREVKIREAKAEKNNQRVRFAMELVRDKEKGSS